MFALKTALPSMRSVAMARGLVSARSFSSSASMRNVATSSLPAKKPVGAFRGGLVGFLAGSLTAGASVYYYILREYRASNEILSEDISALQSATHRLQIYIGELESKVDQLKKK